MYSIELFIRGLQTMMVLFAFVSYIVHKKDIYIWYSLYFLSNFLFLSFIKLPFVKHSIYWVIAEILLFASLAFFSLIIEALSKLISSNRQIIFTKSHYVGLSTIFFFAIIFNFFFAYSWNILLIEHHIGLCIIYVFVRKQNRSSINFLDLNIGFVLRILSIIIFFSTKTINSLKELDGMLVLNIGVILQGTFTFIGIIISLDSLSKENQQLQSSLEVQRQESIIQKKAIDEFKNEIKRNLHDDIGSQLSVISTLCSATKTIQGSDYNKSVYFLDKIIDTAGGVSESFNMMLIEKKEQIIETDNFNLLLEEIPQLLFVYPPIDYKISLPPLSHWTKYNSFELKNIYYIYKEILVNIKKHSEALNVSINFIFNKNHLLMTITDDGKGFDVSKKGQGNGITNIKNRVKKVKGNISIQSKIHSGTSIMIKI